MMGSWACTSSTGRFGRSGAVGLGCGEARSQPNPSAPLRPKRLRSSPGQASRCISRLPPRELRSNPLRAHPPLNPRRAHPVGGLRPLRAPPARTASTRRRRTSRRSPHCHLIWGIVEEHSMERTAFVSFLALGVSPSIVPSPALACERTDTEGGRGLLVTSRRGCMF